MGTWRRRQKARSDGPVEVPTSKMPEPEQVIKLSNATPCGTIIVERTCTHSCSLRSTDFPLHPCATLLVMKGASFGVVGCVCCHATVPDEHPVPSAVQVSWRVCSSSIDLAVWPRLCADEAHQPVPAYPCCTCDCTQVMLKAPT